MALVPLKVQEGRVNLGPSFWEGYSLQKIGGRKGREGKRRVPRVGVGAIGGEIGVFPRGEGRVWAGKGFGGRN